MNKSIFIALLSLVLVRSGNALANRCEVLSEGADGRLGSLDDGFQRLVSKVGRCPLNVIDLRKMLVDSGAKLTTTMVANRGFHNPRAGSFSFFEMAEFLSPSTLGLQISNDQLMFGHFTMPVANDGLDLDQVARSGALMIEMIAWDFDKDVFNFYELIGQDTHSRWYYRGDSSDIWADTKELNLPGGESTNPFGNRLRCSGCHIAGGPIMKELETPNDSWWTENRPLSFGARKPTAQLRAVLSNTGDAHKLSQSVKAGLIRLFSGKAFQKQVLNSPRIALKPLFCAQEINLTSSLDTLDDVGGSFGIPSEFIADPRLSAPRTISYSREKYFAALRSVNSQFPETRFQDADHGWLVPVKAWSERASIEQLVKMGLITDEFVADVLAIDMTRPLFSKDRCALLKHVPESWSATWLEDFKKSLASGRKPSEIEVLQNLNDLSHDGIYHSERAGKIIAKCEDWLENRDDYVDLLEYAGQIRNEIKVSDLSRNPRGQILEPGFRVVFPEWGFAYAPFSKTLDHQCVM